MGDVVMRFLRGLVGTLAVFGRDIASAEQGLMTAEVDAHRLQSQRLATKLRWLGLVVVAILLPFIYPGYSVLYYEAFVVFIAVLGWVRLKLYEKGVRYFENPIIVLELVLFTILMVVPNPLQEADWPVAMSFRFESFLFYFMFLARAVFFFSWRHVLFIGFMSSALWLSAALIVAFWSAGDPALRDAANLAFARDPGLAAMLDPTDVQLVHRVQEVVILLIVTTLLAVSVYNSQKLLIKQVSVERENALLSRYFSPNVLDELAGDGLSLRAVRTQSVAVLFVDIVGFTEFAARRNSEDVIATLQKFFGLMEPEVFRHRGTLDKYLGDGLMATFGTPATTSSDALNAMSCARAMIEKMDDWNLQRVRAGEEALEVSLGLHFGPVVLGDIGNERLEFAVIGSTVNVASRLEEMTRELGAVLVVSGAVVDELDRSEPGVGPALKGLEPVTDHGVRGIDETIPLWIIPRRRTRGIGVRDSE